MTDIGFIILVRMPRCVTAIQDDGEIAVFADEESAHKLMETHILGQFPYQIVELDI